MFLFAVVRQLAPGLRARYYIGAEMPYEKENKRWAA
jgi:hypothetical protein